MTNALVERITNRLIETGLIAIPILCYFAQLGQEDRVFVCGGWLLMAVSYGVLRLVKA